MVTARYGVAAGIIALVCWMPAAMAIDEKRAEPLDGLLKTFVAEFIEVTPGKGKFPSEFPMGSPENVKIVQMSRAFRMAKYEVPQNLYQAVVGVNPSRWTGPRNSVEIVDHQEAIAFCKKATGLLRERKLIGADQTIRLPTETEWEYVCRAGSKSAYSFGNDPEQLKDYAWYNENAAGNDPPVGAKEPNDWGFFDMHGYLWEWVASASTNGNIAGVSTADQILRGGAWTSTAAECRSHSRKVVPAKTRGPDIGFRCVLD